MAGSQDRAPLLAAVAQTQADVGAGRRALNDAATRVYNAAAALDDQQVEMEAIMTRDAHFVYRKVDQAKRGLLSPDEQKMATLRKTNTPEPVFVAILVHDGMHVNNAFDLSEQIAEACNLLSRQNIQRCVDSIMACIMNEGPAARRALNDYLLALSAGLTPTSATDNTPQGDGFAHLTGDTPRDRRVNMLFLVSLLLRRVLQDLSGLSELSLTQFPNLIPRSDGVNAKIRWLKRLLMHLFTLASAGGGSDSSSYGETLDGVLENWGQNLHPIFTRLDLRNLKQLIDDPDIRTPAWLNDHAFDDPSSALRARLFGDPIVPVAHGLQNAPLPPFHQLPAGNFSRMLRERGSPLIARAAPRTGYLFDDGGKPWDASTKAATEDIMKEMLRQYEPTNADEVQDINDLGNKVWKDPERPTRNFWGFSEEGLAAMKANREKEKKTAIGYGDVPAVRSSEIERARELAAAARGRGGGLGSGGRGGRGRGGFRGGRGY